MFTSHKPSSAIDAVTFVKGTVEVDPATSATKIELQMMYSNRESGASFGLCPVRDTTLTEETLSALETFIELAERDFGQLVVEGGFHLRNGGRLGDVRQAESNDGLAPKGIGER